MKLVAPSGQILGSSISKDRPQTRFFCKDRKISTGLLSRPSLWHAVNVWSTMLPMSLTWFFISSITKIHFFIRTGTTQIVENC